jgi:hypothetical protein
MRTRFWIIFCWWREGSPQPTSLTRDRPTKQVRVTQGPHIRTHSIIICWWREGSPPPIFRTRDRPTKQVRPPTQWPATANFPDEGSPNQTSKTTTQCPHIRTHWTVVDPGLDQTRIRERYWRKKSQDSPPHPRFHELSEPSVLINRQLGRYLNFLRQLIYLFVNFSHFFRGVYIWFYSPPPPGGGGGQWPKRHVGKKY